MKIEKVEVFRSKNGDIHKTKKEAIMCNLYYELFDFCTKSFLITDQQRIDSNLEIMFSFLLNHKDLEEIIKEFKKQ